MTRSAALQDEFAAALLDSGRSIPAGLRTWNGSDPAARFAVYRNNVVYGLVNALADSFPVVRALVGEAFFSAMGTVFVRGALPTSAVLAFYGADFPAFVESFEPAREIPYLADVARLEFARIRAYHAADAGAIDAATIDRATRSGDRSRDVGLELHPSVTPLVFHHPAVSIWNAHQVEQVTLEHIDMAEAESALVLRQAMDVIIVSVSSATARLAQAFAQGRALGAAVDDVSALDAEFDLFHSLGTLFRHGAVTAIHFPAED